MIIKAYYAGGRIDVFDTDHLIDEMPQKGNLLTNYTLDLADVGEESLWLRSYYYEAADAYKEGEGPYGLPVARRRDGWSFLIADEEDLENLNRLTIDGETALIRLEEEVVDVVALENIYCIFEEYMPKIQIAYRNLLNEKERLIRSSENEMFELIGVPNTVIYKLFTDSNSIE